MAWTTAGSRSGMGGYELLDQLSEQLFSGLQAGMSPISLVQLEGSVRKFNPNRPFILPIFGSILKRGEADNKSRSMFSVPHANVSTNVID